MVLTAIMQCPQRQLARIVIQVALDEALAFPHEPRAAEPQESCANHGWSVMRQGSEIRGEPGREGRLCSSNSGPGGRACHFAKVRCRLSLRQGTKPYFVGYYEAQSRSYI